MNAFKSLETLIPPEGEDIPGFGGTAFLPDIAISREGQNIRQEIATIRNSILKARSGGAVTPSEAGRMLEELGTGVGRTDAQMRRGIKNARKVLETRLKSTFAGFSKEAVEEFGGRGGFTLDQFISPAGKTSPKGDLAKFSTKELQKKLEDLK